MLRTSLFLAFFVLSMAFTGKTFENKNEAINYLNNSNIWLAGMPIFSIDHRNGFLHIKQSTEAGSINTHLPLAEISTVFTSGKVVTVELNCALGSYCCMAETGNKKLETDGITLILSSTFDDGTYRDRYLEQGAKISEALEYLISFYAK